MPGHPGRYYLGQPVEVGAVSALRVCAGMPLITELSVTVLRGESLHAALMPIRQSLAQLFAKLAVLDADLSASTAVAPAQPSKRKAG